MNKQREPNEFDYYIPEEEKRRLGEEAILARINRLSAPLRYHSSKSYDEIRRTRYGPGRPGWKR